MAGECWKEGAPWKGGVRCAGVIIGGQKLSEVSYSEVPSSKRCGSRSSKQTIKPYNTLGSKHGGGITPKKKLQHTWFHILEGYDFYSQAWICEVALWFGFTPSSCSSLVPLKPPKDFLFTKLNYNHSFTAGDSESFSRHKFSIYHVFVQCPLFLAFPLFPGTYYCKQTCTHSPTSSLFRRCFTCLCLTLTLCCWVILW